jgi:hypothetical protein
MRKDTHEQMDLGFLILPDHRFLYTWIQHTYLTWYRNKMKGMWISTTSRKGTL